MSEYKWSWKRAGRVVKTISENRTVLTIIIANSMLLITSLGLFNFTEADVQKVSVEMLTTALLVVNSIAFFIGRILEARRETDDTTENEKTTIKPDDSVSI